LRSESEHSSSSLQRTQKPRTSSSPVVTATRRITSSKPWKRSLALLLARGIEAGIEHRLEELFKRFPSDDEWPARLLPFVGYSAYATAFRYPTPGGRDPRRPASRRASTRHCLASRAHRGGSRRTTRFRCRSLSFRNPLDPRPHPVQPNLRVAKVRLPVARGRPCPTSEPWRASTRFSHRDSKSTLIKNDRVWPSRRHMRLRRLSTTRHRHTR
jgi:hypothetical protein